ncbi:MAG: 2-(1,2-epoxy-1,2-dihydrophenyl)acetyl-CoA isomerase [Pyrinomonadaceae bacterium]|nr:2-(1,2-epoxy-1,2-dihydrophenyl)acetyl-CoA isomerase [Pyrinomonadaceae bacterium]
MYETVNYELRENVAVIELNRPDALNALSRQLTSDLTAAIEKASADRARCVLLTAAGRAFCSGGDLREMQLMWEQEGRIEAFLEAPLEALHNLISSIAESPIPFLAAVGGVCAGAGTNVALACDLVIAAEGSKFNEAFVKIGLSPDCGGSFFLPRAVGTKLAAELLMTGDTITAERAAEIGMINRVVPADKLGEESIALATKLSLGPTAAIARVKKMLNATFSNDLSAQLELEHELQIESGRSGDFKEGVQAFFEKRMPDFKGD